MLTLNLSVEHGVIASADLTVSHLHRGAEKLFEVRDYRQIMLLANRHDWLSAFSNELGVALAVEQQLGLEVPERATWIRTAIAELNRVVHHLAFLTPLAWPDRESAGAAPGHTAREGVQGLLEQATGGRLHFMASRIGGLRQDVPRDWTDDVRSHLRTLDAVAKNLAERILGPDGAASQWRGIGTISSEEVDAFGLSGAQARASGADFDLRRDDPYLAYAELGDAMQVPVRIEGDARARIEVLIEQLDVARALVLRACEGIDRVGPGPIGVLLPKVLRVPEGTTYAWTESPGGINGYVLVSRGDKVPWRLKLRSASFSNASVIPHLAEDATIDELVPLLQSLQIVIGDLAK